MLRYPAVIRGVTSGQDFPQGATYDGLGTNFALYSEHAERVELCLYDDDSQEQAVVPLPSRTRNVWHGFVAGVGPGQRYGYRVSGPYAPERGHYFDRNKLLIDPYARLLDRAPSWHHELQVEADASFPSGFAVDSGPVAARSVVVDDAFDWEDDAPPRIPWRDTVLYECHVKGLTQLHPALAPELRGTFLGLAAPEILDHLRALGVTAVQLLPVQQAFSERHVVQRNAVNYWGYNTIGFFAPDRRLATAGPHSDPVREWKRMVQALHRAGLEVILDVVYNHTGEADPTGPLLSLRGIDNAVYYRLDPNNRRRYIDTTGCGNSLNFDHPQTQRLVMDSLRYWVREMHVDGFRFDLAPTLARGAHGLDLHGRMFAMIAQDPLLAQTKLIVEPWDMGYSGYGALQTGGFGVGYAEWNDRYRDTLRRFVRGDGGQVGDLATRVSGSSDLFGAEGRGPLASINFVACHDGKSLYDLVSYEGKYNWDNGWDNRDGSDAEFARNWGVEGPSDSPETNNLRERVMRSALLTLACSQGVPMLRQGDELGHTQRGNNNAYAQDNAVSWLDWSLGPTARGLLEFTRAALAERRAMPELRRDSHFRGELSDHTRDVTWLRPDGAPMQPEDFHARERRTLGMWLAGARRDGPALLVLWNGDAVATTFRLPAGTFELRLDSALALAPGTLCEHALRVEAHACVLLVAKLPEAQAREVPSELDRELLGTLAARSGIADSYLSYTRQVQETSAATRLALLSALGIDARTNESCRAALAELEREERAPGLRPVRVLPEGSDALRRFSVSLPESAGGPLSYHTQLTLESGEHYVLQGSVRDAGRRIDLALPSDVPLPTGYHELSVYVTHGSARAEQHFSQQLVITPRTFPRVSQLLGPRRGAGLWAHIYALHSEQSLGLGDLGDLRALLSFAAEQGLDFVGINPLHAVDNFAAVVSPYYPLSRVYANPIYLEIDAVPEFAYSELARSQLGSSSVQQALAQLTARPRRDYAAAWRLKRRLLHALHTSFEAHEHAKETVRGRAYDAFVAQHGDALRDFATFCAIAESLAPAPSEAPVYDFRQFPVELRDAKSPAVAAKREQLAAQVAFHMYLQFELFRQIEGTQHAARAQGLAIGLYGDLAVGNAAGGSDVWAHPELFARGVELGAPPDPYSDVGQTWGLVPLVPQALVRDRFAYFRRLACSAVRSCGMLRIDHVMGLQRQFWVPHGRSAREGGYVRFPFEELAGILALEASRTATLIVGEDLGVVSEGLRERMSQLSMLRSQVVCFERDDDGAFRSSERYVPASLATVNTHDMPPLLGYFDALDLELLRLLGQLSDPANEQRLRAERAAAKRALLELLQREGLGLAPGPGSGHGEHDDTELTVAVHRFLARTQAQLVAASLDDVCLEIEPLNVPGIASAEHPSWSKRTRLSVEAMTRDMTVLRSLAALRERCR